MCGIVGLLVKTPALRERLGDLLVPMMIGMTERGPDSAGLAVYTEPRQAGHKFSLFSSAHEVFNWGALAENFEMQLHARPSCAVHGNHAKVIRRCRFHSAQAVNSGKGWNVEIIQQLTKLGNRTRELCAGANQSNRTLGFLKQ